MAADLESGAETSLPALPSTQRRSYRDRFLVAYVVLGLLAGVAAAGGYLLLTGDGRAPDEAWSTWRPTGEDATFPSQIAEFVAPRYRLPETRNQIVGIVAGPPEVQDIAVRAVAIQRQNASSSEDIDVLPADHTLMYVLCGFGENCSIREGEASQERHRLLRREALELALYTFKYLDGIDSVIALLPPPPNTETNGTALFFQKGTYDFRRALDRPLADTLQRSDPPAPQVVEITAAESVRIDRLTRPYLFTYEFQQLQEGSAVIVLAPVSANE